VRAIPRPATRVACGDPDGHPDISGAGGSARAGASSGARERSPTLHDADRLAPARLGCVTCRCRVRQLDARAATRRRRDARRRRALESHSLAHARPSHRRALVGSAHGEAVVQWPARLLAGCVRLRRPRVSAARRPDRLRGWTAGGGARVWSAPAHDQRVRVARSARPHRGAITRCIGRPEITRTGWSQTSAWRNYRTSRNCCGRPIRPRAPPLPGLVSKGGLKWASIGRLRH